MAVVLLRLNVLLVTETSVEMKSNVGPVYLDGVKLSLNIQLLSNVLKFGVL